MRDRGAEGSSAASAPRFEPDESWVPADERTFGLDRRTLPPTLAARCVAIAIVIATIAGIMLSQYMIWSIVCGDAIEGVQGRYFLPILPLALLAIGFSIPRLRIDARVIAVIAVVCNAFAFVAIIRRYWM